MGACIVLTPMIAAAWPLVSASVLGAATALGFAAAGSESKQTVKKEECIRLDIKNSQAVTDELGNDRKLSFVKDGVTVTFGRDARGKCEVSVTGGLARERLEEVGREFSQQVVQQYAYHRLMNELAAQNFSVVQQEVGEDKVIHVQVRRFQ